MSRCERQGVSWAESGEHRPVPRCPSPDLRWRRYLPTSSLRRLLDQTGRSWSSPWSRSHWWLFFWIDSPYFFTTANAATLAAFIAPIAFFAVAEVLILILGEIDLSVGEVYVLSPFIVKHFNNVGVPIPLGLVLSMLICGVIG